MQFSKEAPKRLILGTLVGLMALVGGVILIHQHDLPEGVEIKWKHHPTIGYSKAKVHVVVFEEPKCVNCRDFSLELFPKIKKEYIDTGMITYTTIPVSFLPGSMPAAIALLCVYYADPLYPNTEAFYQYLDYMYQNFPGEHEDWATTENLTKMAANASPAINVSALNQCIEKQTYHVRVQKNTRYGAKLLGGTISTPSVFVNGIEAKELSWDGLKNLIDEVCDSLGVEK